MSISDVDTAHRAYEIYLARGRERERRPPGRDRDHMADITRKRRGLARPDTLNLDEALIAVLSGAMNANDHVAAGEASRAHDLIGSTRRFRRKSGERVGELIEDMRGFVGEVEP